MNDGFFSASTLAQSKQPMSLVPKCGLCQLFAHCNSPKMPVTGKGNKGILIVGEAPSKNDDENNRQFTGKTGELLRSTLQKFGVNPNKDCWFTNALICFTGDVEIQSPSKIEIGYRRTYTGNLIQLKTSTGRTLTGTPNHPILTPNGWIALGLLKEGDNLVCGSLSQGISLGGPDINNPPTTFKKVFDSLLKFGNIKRMIGSRMNFHGDGEDGNVDVVCPNSLLGDGSESSINKHSSQTPFTSSDKILSDLLPFSTLQSNFVPLLDRPLPSSDSVMDSFSQSQPALFPQLKMANSHSIASTSNRNTQTNEQNFQLTPSQTEGISKDLQSFPFDISLDSVVNINSISSNEYIGGINTPKGSCHVYNLQTEHGYYLANGIIVGNCHSKNDYIQDTANKIDYCRPNLLKTIQELQPTKIILLGQLPVQSLIGYLWKNSVGSLTRWVGLHIPCPEFNCWICPTYHPTYIARMEREPVYELTFKHHLEEALQLPTEIPTFPKPQIECIQEPSFARTRLKEFFAQEPEVVAFDYETNMLKPDSPKAEIVSCSVSDNSTTLAFPWHKTVIGPMARFLEGPIGKSIHNAKFEQRWTKAKLGIDINNVVWDSMLAAHWLDNRTGVTGLKFQAFAQMGIPPYNEHLESFLKADSGNAINQVRTHIDLHDLLYYNGMDSLIEYRLAKLQGGI